MSWPGLGCKCIFTQLHIMNPVTIPSHLQAGKPRITPLDCPSWRGSKTTSGTPSTGTLLNKSPQLHGYPTGWPRGRDINNHLGKSMIIAQAVMLLWWKGWLCCSLCKLTLETKYKKQSLHYVLISIFLSLKNDLLVSLQPKLWAINSCSPMDQFWRNAAKVWHTSRNWGKSDQGTPFTLLAALLSA